VPGCVCPRSDSFKAALAAPLVGVDSSDITLTIVPASIEVTASFVSATSSDASSSLASLASLSANASHASAVLGVTVESISTPTRTTTMVAPPGAPPGSSSDDDQGGRIAGIVIAAAVAFLLFLSIGIWFIWRSSARDSYRDAKKKKSVVVSPAAMADQFDSVATADNTDDMEVSKPPLAQNSTSDDALNI